MPTNDTFEDLARFYDPIMSHVNYDRWYLIAGRIADLLPRGFTHIDVACGTGTLLKRLRALGWKSLGVDLSFAMLHSGGKGEADWPVAAADMRALPFHETANYVTCLFDSLNFLVEPDEMRTGIRQLAGALKPGGILYLDVVTERMVLEHFAGQEWNEDNDGFTTTWTCDYNRKTHTAASHIRVNGGPPNTIYERIYDVTEIEDAMRAAGLQLLGTLDAERWRPVGRRTLRIDFVAVKGDAKPLQKPFKHIEKDIRVLLA